MGRGIAACRWPAPARHADQLQPASTMASPHAHWPLSPAIPTGAGTSGGRSQATLCSRATTTWRRCSSPRSRSTKAPPWTRCRSIRPWILSRAGCTRARARGAFCAAAISPRRWPVPLPSRARAMWRPMTPIAFPCSSARGCSPRPGCSIAWPEPGGRALPRSGWPSARRERRSSTSRPSRCYRQRGWRVIRPTT